MISLNMKYKYVNFKHSWRFLFSTIKWTSI